MDTRGAGLAATLVALCALLSACGGSAAASVTQPVAIDVESIVLDEISELSELGYRADDPTLVLWEFSEGYENENGGNAAAEYPDAGEPTVIRLNPSLSEYGQSVDPELRIRSTVRHEFGHAVVYAAGYVSSVDDELALRQLCPDPAELAPVNTRWGHECMAEAIAEVLSTDRRMPRHEFYNGTDLSNYSIGSAVEMLAGRLVNE